MPRHRRVYLDGVAVPMIDEVHLVDVVDGQLAVFWPRTFNEVSCFEHAWQCKAGGLQNSPRPDDFCSTRGTLEWDPWDPNEVGPGPARGPTQSSKRRRCMQPENPLYAVGPVGPEPDSAGVPPTSLRNRVKDAIPSGTQKRDPWDPTGWDPWDPSFRTGPGPGRTTPAALADVIRSGSASSDAHQRARTR